MNMVMKHFESRTLYRYVDWNCDPLKRKKWAEGRTLYRYVDWNISSDNTEEFVPRRTLYRYVDWNGVILNDNIQMKVVPYIGTWIETRM